MCSFKPYIVDPTIAEAYATWKALKFSRKFGYSEYDTTDGRTTLKSIQQLIVDAKTVLKVSPIMVCEAHH